MTRAATFLVLLACIIAPGAGRAAEELRFRPGCWVPLPPGASGVIEAPGAATDLRAGPNGTAYALPLSAPWTPQPGSGIEATALRDGAWLVAQLHGGAGLPANREGLLRALPAGSVVQPLGDVRAGVPESVDLVVSYEFSEGSLQPRERDELRAFVRRGGAVLLIYAADQLPKAAEPLWRELFAIRGEPQRKPFGLPRPLRVPDDYAIYLDAEIERLVWQRYGRGLALAYQVPRADRLQTADAASRLFERVVETVRRRRRPVRVEPVERDFYGLFSRPVWAGSTRRRIAWLVAAYAVGAAALLLSFGGLLARRRWLWLVGVAAIAVAGGCAIVGLGVAASGLALDSATIVIREPGADPVQIVIARIARLGPGRAPRLPSAAAMPPRLVLFHRAGAQDTWATYRFGGNGATLEPHLDSGQHVCFVAIRTLSEREAAALRPAATGLSPAPPNADDLIGVVRSRWAVRPAAGHPGLEYGFRWLAPDPPGRAFAPAADAAFAQVHRGPTLLVTGHRLPPRDAPRAANGPKPGTVRVAAVQTYSRMGRLRRNRKRLTWLIRGAAARGAKIVVLPECAVHGYMDPAAGRVWRRSSAPAEDGPAVETVAEPVPGASTHYFGRLARELGVYLVVPLVEVDDGRYYNAQVLIDPRSAIIAHHRKHRLWPVGDSSWATEGDRPVQVVDTPYGRLGLMICYDFHEIPPKLAAAKADIVLYSVGWFAPNPAAWFGDVFPQRFAAKHRMAFVVANWSAEPGAPDWPGFGHSCVIDRTGKVLSMARKQRGPRIVIADLPVRAPAGRR
jgi:predicted amidohydrolase